MEGRFWATPLGQDPLNPVYPVIPLNLVNPLNPLSVPECVFWSNRPTLLADTHDKRDSGRRRSPKCPWSAPDRPNATEGDPT